MLDLFFHQMSIGFKEILILLILILILFGAGKLPQVMRDLGKGIRNFKKGINEDDSSGKE